MVIAKDNQELLRWVVDNIRTWPEGYVRIQTDPVGSAYYTAHSDWIYLNGYWARRVKAGDTDALPTLRLNTSSKLFCPGIVVTREEWELAKMYDKIKDVYYHLKSLKSRAVCNREMQLNTNNTFSAFVEKGKVIAYDIAIKDIHCNLKDLRRDLEND